MCSDCRWAILTLILLASHAFRPHLTALLEQRPFGGLEHRYMALYSSFRSGSNKPAQTVAFETEKSFTGTQPPQQRLPFVTRQLCYQLPDDSEVCVYDGPLCYTVPESHSDPFGLGRDGVLVVGVEDTEGKDSIGKARNAAGPGAACCSACHFVL